MLRDGEIDLQAPEEEEPSGCHPPAGGSETEPRELGEQVPAEHDFEGVAEEKDNCPGKERVGQPIVIKRATEFAEEKVMQSSRRATEYAGQSGYGAARSGEWKPARERTRREEGKRDERGQ